MEFKRKELWILSFLIAICLLGFFMSNDLGWKTEWLLCACGLGIVIWWLNLNPEVFRLSNGIWIISIIMLFLQIKGFFATEDDKGGWIILQFMGYVFLGLCGSGCAINTDERIKDVVSWPPAQIITTGHLNVIASLELQRNEAERETLRLKKQLESEASKIGDLSTMKKNLQRLQQQMADSEQVKRDLEREVEMLNNRGEASLTMRDSVVAGDAWIGSTNIEKQVLNDPKAIAIAAVEAYRMAKNEDQKK